MSNTRFAVAFITSLGGKKKWFWNAFFIIVYVVCLLLFAVMFMDHIDTFFATETKEIYVECTDKTLITESASYPLPSSQKQRIPISEMKKFVSPQKEIVVAIGAISKEVVMIRSDEQILFQRKKVDNNFIAGLIAFIVMNLLFGFVFYVINAKYPNKRIKKMQRALWR